MGARNTDLPYPGIVRLGVVDHQLTAGPGAADGDPRVVSAGLGVCSTDAALRVHLVAGGGRPPNVEWLRVDEEAVVELALGVAGDLHHLALSGRGVPVGDAGGAHRAALQTFDYQQQQLYQARQSLD